MKLPDCLKGNEPLTEEECCNKKIEILELTKEKEQYLRELEFKCIYETDVNDTIMYEAIIDVNDILGTSRYKASKINSWLDYIMQDAHKIGTFEMYKRNKDKFERFLLGDKKDLPMELKGIDGLPVVLKKDDKYYINDDGKHRICIAKAMGFSEIKVIVKE